MDWSNERYVRLYTRDTETVLLQSWQARAVFREMLRKCDRAGVIECRTGPRGLAVVLNMPPEVVVEQLPTLLADGSVATCEGGYVLPNFIEAQEAPQSDKQRAKESRERRRDRARSPAHVTKRDSVDNRHSASHGAAKRDTPVTDRDETITERTKTSHAVTPRHTASLQPSVPSVPSQPEPAASRARATPAAGDDPGTPGHPDADTVSATARTLCVAANLAIAARYGEQTRPLRPGHGHTVALTQSLLEAHVPLEFAAEAIRSLVATRSDPEPPGAMTWFAKGITRLWGEERARRDAASGTAPGLGTARSVIRGNSFFDGLRAEIEKGTRS